MNVVALSDSIVPWHSFWIRVGQYLNHLPLQVQISDRADSIDRLGDGDRLIVYRYSHDWGNLAARLRMARERGVRVICDLDDYLWEARGWDRQRLLAYTRVLRESNLITCSTKPLLEQIQTMFPRAALRLLVNTAPLAPARPVSQRSQRLRIGWTGAPWTRPNDLEILQPLGQWLAGNSSRFQIVHVGHSPRHLSFAQALGIASELVETHPLQGHADYLRQLDFDIGLAPLAKSSFNNYKSAIKVIEYSNLGIPWIASQVTPYEQICQEWSWQGRLCRSPEEWIEHVRALVNEQARSMEGARLAKRCEKYHSFKQGVLNWYNIDATTLVFMEENRFTVPDSAPAEDKAICQLVNSGHSPQQLFRAAYTFYRATLEQQLSKEGPVKVQSGLFRGMSLYPGSLASQLLPKWLGTYEAEVQHILKAHGADYDCFLDIGCAEGFYLTGMALLYGITCQGVDIDPRAKSATAYASQQNGVSHLVNVQDCVATAVAACHGKTMIMIDVDGNEDEVLDELEASLASHQKITDLMLVVETDKGVSSEQNTANLITRLCYGQWLIRHVAQQSPTLRFEGSLSEYSFLEQAVRGAEGRPGGQRWIVATKSKSLKGSRD